MSFSSMMGPGVGGVGMTRGRIMGAQNGLIYPSPFFDLAQQYMPRSMKELHRWCRYYFYSSPLINATVTKLASYPVTDIIIDKSLSAEAAERWDLYLSKTLHYNNTVVETGLDFLVYGMCFVDVSFPFRKLLKCMPCGFVAEAKKIRRHWIFTNHQFRLTCPKCKAVSDAPARDSYLKDASAIRIRRWNPENIDIANTEYTNTSHYFYTIPGPIRADITVGRKDVVEAVPQAWIVAVRERKSLLLPADNLFVMKRPGLAEQDRGWGLPLLMPVLKDAFYLRILQKAQESLLAARILPFEILFPQPGSGAADPFTSTNLLEWKEQVHKEIARFRMDSNYMALMPLPIGHQTIGGDGKALLLGQEMQQYNDIILAGMGVPHEFAFGGGNFSGSAVSMRMMENWFINYMGNQQNLLEFVIRQVAGFLDWPICKARFKPFKAADDLQRRALEFQENQAGLLSDTTYLSGADRSASDEQDLIVEETARKMKAQEVKQMATAKLQGDVGIVMAKFQAAAQRIQQAAVQQQPAQGEPGGQVAQDPMVGAESQISAKPMQGGGLLDMAGQQARFIASLDPTLRETALQNIDQLSPDLSQTIRTMVKQQAGGAGSAGGPPAVGVGIDARPNPEQKPPRRTGTSI